MVRWSGGQLISFIALTAGSPFMVHRLESNEVSAVKLSLRGVASAEDGSVKNGKWDNDDEHNNRANTIRIVATVSFLMALP